MVGQPRSTPREIQSIYVIPPYNSLQSPAEAIAFIEAFDESKPYEPFARYEVGVRYSNGDEIRGQFKDKMTAVAFLCGIR
jgi:hypothetical protein